MKKYLTIFILSLLIIVFCTQNTFARVKRVEMPKNYLTFSFVIHPASVGYKHLIAENIYLTTNLDYVHSDSELYFQSGAAYMIPYKFLIFRFYGGSGLQFSRNHGYQSPYVMLGTKIWIFYTEIVYFMQRHETPGYRLGFIASF